MTNVVKRWRDTDHLRRAVETAGGQEAFELAVSYTRWEAIRAEHVRRAGGEEAVAVGKEELQAQMDDGTLRRSREGAGHYGGDG